MNTVRSPNLSCTRNESDDDLPLSCFTSPKQPSQQLPSFSSHACKADTQHFASISKPVLPHSISVTSSDRFSCDSSRHDIHSEPALHPQPKMRTYSSGQLGPEKLKSLHMVKQITDETPVSKTTEKEVPKKNKKFNFFSLFKKNKNKQKAQPTPQEADRALEKALEQEKRRLEKERIHKEEFEKLRKQRQKERRDINQFLPRDKVKSSHSNSEYISVTNLNYANNKSPNCASSFNLHQPCSNAPATGSIYSSISLVNHKNPSYYQNNRQTHYALNMNNHSRTSGNNSFLTPTMEPQMRQSLYNQSSQQHPRVSSSLSYHQNSASGILPPNINFSGNRMPSPQLGYNINSRINSVYSVNQRQFY